MSFFENSSAFFKIQLACPDRWLMYSSGYYYVPKEILHEYLKKKTDKSSLRAGPLFASPLDPKGVLKPHCRDMGA